MGAAARQECPEGQGRALDEEERRELLRLQEPPRRGQGAQADPQMGCDGRVRARQPEAGRCARSLQYRQGGLGGQRLPLGADRGRPESEGLAEPYPPARRTRSTAVRAPEVGEHDALEGTRPCRARIRPAAELDGRQDRAHHRHRAGEVQDRDDEPRLQHPSAGSARADGACARLSALTGGGRVSCKRPARRQSGPRSGAHLGTSAATARSAKAAYCSRSPYARKGKEVVKKNFEAIDAALAKLFEVKIPAAVSGDRVRHKLVPDTAPEFVRNVISPMLALHGDDLPVSALPADGTYPTATAQYEKRNIAEEVPVWNPDLCIQCGQCAVVCPHSVIRAKYYDEDRLADAPADFKAAPINARGYPDSRYTLQVYVEDCTGCGVCVENCPAHSSENFDIRAINMKPRLEHLESGRRSIEFFEKLPWPDRTRVNFANVRGAQFLQPLFEFSGACAGCGETPYLKMLSQLFGDRLQIANATGCSSIYGGNLPTTPWAKNPDGRGPAWSNSLFEDNAEFGLGYRLAIDKQTELAHALARKLAPQIGEDLVRALLDEPQITESDFRIQRERVAALKEKLAPMGGDEAANLMALADFFVRRSVWLVGGDGWAYDIGYGGLDHVLASGRNVNVLVLDTEVYSNTGGQASKATPLGASAKFAAAGKRVPRKDLALMAIAYGNVYVAQVAMGANSEHTLIAMREAEAYSGPSLILAYSQCIAHGTDMRFGMKQAARATASGYWPLFRFDPTMRQRGMNPFRLDSTRPRIPLEDYRYNEVRFKSLTQTRPDDARHMLAQAQLELQEKYRIYEDMAARDGSRFHPHWEEV